MSIPPSPGSTLPAGRPFALRLRTKLIIPYVILTVIVVLAGAYLAAHTMARSLQERFDQQLHDAGTVVADSVVEVEREHLATLRAIAHTEGLPAAVEQEDVDAIRAVVLPLVFNARVDCADVVSLAGQGLWAMHRRQDMEKLDYDTPLASSYASWSLVQRVAAGEVDEFGDKFTALVQADWGDVFYTAGPIKDGDRLVGVVLVGTYVNELPRRFDQVSLARVTLYDLRGHVLATSMGTRDPAATGLTAEQVAAILQDQRTLVHRRLLTVGSVDYTEIFAPFEARHGHDLGVFSVALSRGLIAETSEPLRQWLVVLFSGAILAIIAIGLALGTHIARPILELVQATRRVAEGDLNTQVSVRSGDEIGMLAHAFNQMVQGLRERDLIKDAFGRLVTREVREQILSGEVKLHGESRVVTTLFTDIREFTRLSERYDPAEVVKFLNEYFSVVVEAVELYGGTVNKFGGDSTLVIFGAPQHQPDHPLRAIQASLEIRQRLGELNIQRIARGELPIYTGMGINTGEAVAGTIGSEQRMEYTVIGDAVNVSARIQGLTRQYVGYDILVSQATYDALGDNRAQFQFQELGQEMIRGRRESITIYALLDRAARAADPAVTVTTPLAQDDEAPGREVASAD